MATSGSKSVAVTSYDTLKFSWTLSSQSVANNTSVITWKMELISASGGAISSSASKSWYVIIDGTKYSGTNTIGIGNNSTKTLASGTHTISHNSDGTKTFEYTFSQEFTITFSGTYIGSKTGIGSGTLTTIPRKSSLSASSGTLGTAQTLTVNRHSSSFTHTITYKCGSASGTIATKSSSTSISWTPPLSLASQNTTGTSVSIVFTITTYNGNTSIGSSTTTINASIPSSVAPSCTLTHSDPTGYKDKYGSYIKGVSKIKVVVTPTISYGSPIASYSIYANSETSVSTRDNFTTSELTLDSGSIKATVTDKRGRSGSASTTYTTLSYSPPVISTLKVKRTNADGTENGNGEFVQVVFSSKVTALTNKNSAAYTLEYKKTTESEYTSVELTDYVNDYEVKDGTYIFAADTGASYNVRLLVTDDINTTSKTTVASTGFTLMHYLASGLGMAIGKIAELTNVFDIGFQTRFMGGILHPILEPETDLNDVRTPNTYVGANATTYNYGNCPITSGTFTLEVLGAGAEGQTKQRLSVCNKTTSRIFERFYYQSTWGEWVCVSDYAGTLLAGWGVMPVVSTHTINLAEPISKQKNGIVLVFSEFINGEATDQTFSCHFIPKKEVELHQGKGHVFQMCTSNLAYVGTNYLYISDEKITGHNNNNLAETTSASGIKHTNNRFVLRHVIGV